MMIYFAIALSYLSLMILGLVDNLRGPLYPDIISSFEIHHSQGAWIFAMTSMMSFFGALFSTKLFKYLDYQKSLNLALFLMAMGLFIFGNSESFSLFIIGSLFFGFSMGLMGVVQNLLVTKYSPSRLHQQLLSGLHAMYGFASLLAPIYVNLYYRFQFNWKEIFLYSSLIPLGLFVLSLFHSLPKTQDSINLQETVTKVRMPIWSISILAMVLCGYVMGEIMISSRLAFYFRDIRGFGFEASNFKVTLFFLFLLMGRLFFSFYKFKISVRHQLLISLAGTVFAILSGLFFRDEFLILSGLTMAPFYPLMVSFISSEFKLHQNHALTVSMAVQSSGIVVMHLGVGWVTDLFGIQRALLLGPLFLIISFFLLKFYKSMT